MIETRWLGLKLMLCVERSLYIRGTLRQTTGEGPEGEQRARGSFWRLREARVPEASAQGTGDMPVLAVSNQSGDGQAVAGNEFTS